METWLNWMLRSIEVIIAVGALIMGVGAGLKRVYRMAKNIEGLVEKVDKNGEVAAALGQRLELAIEEIASTRHKVTDIKKEVLPNGGSSLRDAVNRIETRVSVLETWHQAEGALARDTIHHR